MTWPCASRASSIPSRASLGLFHARFEHKGGAEALPLAQSPSHYSPRKCFLVRKASSLINGPLPLKQADESLNFEEQILEAAKSIAAATSALVKAASAAQRELVAQGKVSEWGEGGLGRKPSSLVWS